MAEPLITFEGIQTYRSTTFRILPGKRVHNREQAIEFVNQRGFIFFWPIIGIPMPSLWAAVAGDRPVADAHDDPGHITWDWKDSLLGSRQWYYAKVLRKKATMISFDALPYFYALSENYGSPEEDYLTLYEQGRLTLESKILYETLLKEGVLDTVELRKATHMTSKASNSCFERALADLQADFKILPVGVTQSGAWHYAFAYDIVARRYPELLDQAQPISEDQARRRLAELYFRSLGAAQSAGLVKLFGWKPAHVQRILELLVQEGLLCRGIELQNHPGEWFALKELMFD